MSQTVCNNGQKRGVVSKDVGDALFWAVNDDVTDGLDDELACLLILGILEAGVNASEESVKLGLGDGC